jgi:general secretion pathway protein C
MNAASWREGLSPPDRLRALLLAEGPRFATWFLALALGVQAALIVTDIAGGDRGTHSAAAPPRPGAPARVVDVATIANAHLFGTAPVPKGDDANAPASSVALILTGIIAGDDPQSGLAILGPNAQSAKVHAVGDTVAGGVKLHSVYADRVIIDRNGQLESLTLPRQVSGTAPAPSAATLPIQSPVVDRMRKALTEQPGLIADLLRPQAVMDGDKVKGFRVYPGRNRLAFARLGLRPGDEVIAINGTPLDDQDRGQAILSTLTSSSEARVTVIRNNQQQDLTLNIAQVAQEAETATGLQPGPFSGGPGPGLGPNGGAGFAPAQAPPPPGAGGPAPQSDTLTQSNVPAAAPGAPATVPGAVPPAPVPPPEQPEGTTPPQDSQ